MYRKAEFFKMKYPLKIEELKSKFSGVDKSTTRKIEDKNSEIRKIELDSAIEHKKAKDENYLVGLDFQYQISPRHGVPYQKTRDFYGLIFLPKYQLLVILGRDDAISEVITFVAGVLYPDVKEHIVFNHIRFETDSLVNTIKKLRKDDEDSWCNDYNGKHGAIKYQGRKTKSNFSLGEGSCILDDKEAIDAIEHSTSISPTFKFYKCPKLTSKTYDSPKTISFNGENGSVSISVAQDFDNWYKFISEFLVKEIKW